MAPRANPISSANFLLAKDLKRPKYKAVATNKIRLMMLEAVTFQSPAPKRPWAAVLTVPTNSGVEVA